MINLKHGLSIFILFVSMSVFAQKTNWVKKMMSGDHTFKEIQDQFNSDWGNHEYSKGHGWKQYKRWEYFWSTRLMPDGSFPDYTYGFNSFDRYMETDYARVTQSGKWTPLGPTSYTTTSSWSPGMGRVNFILEDPNDSSTLYVGTPGGGAWKSIDNGSTWVPLSDNLAAIGISSIGISKSNSQIIYMATGDANGGDTPSIGVVKSIDGGVSWSIVGSTSDVPGRLADVLVDPSDANIVYVASRTEGVFKTINGGTSWSKLISGTYRDIEFKPGNSQVIYAAGESDIQVSTNSGASWNQAMGIPNGMTRIALGVTPADDSYVYALIADEEGQFQGIYLSTNSGNSFLPRNTTTDCFEGDQSWYDMAIGVSSTNKNLIFTGVLNVWKSSDGGNTLSKINEWYDYFSPTYTHADIHFIRYYGGNMYCGTDGGIYKSTNDGNAFTDLSEGLQIGQFYRISGIENNEDAIAGGLQDNGSYLRVGTNWRIWLGADGMDNAINPNNPMEAYGMTQNGGLNKTEDGGLSYEDISDGVEGNWVTPLAYDATANRVLVGYDQIYEYNGSWTTISDFDYDDNLNCLELAPSNNKIIYTSVGSNIYRTADDGDNITDITNNLSSINSDENNITSIEVHNTDPSKLWVTFGGFTAGVKVAFSSNSGASWTNVSGTLPNLPCNIVKLDGTSSEAESIYVGMDVGVYYKNSALSDFIPFMTDLPKVQVLDIEINETNDKVRVGTYGRGVWESPTYAPSVTIDNDNDGFNDMVDCNDNDPAINPDAEEICNGIDDNCDGNIDEGVALNEYFQDSDNDGYGNEDSVIEDCELPDGYATNSDDCDDTDASINPGATDIPNNGIDEDCDGSDAVDIVDNDNDGFDNTEDCNDNDPDVNPDATEICNGIDDNCDGDVDEGIALNEYFQDSDNDGYGNANSVIEDCELPDGYVTNADDCDDTNTDINPDATDIPDNGIDEDCDGQDATDVVDADNDGFDNTEDCDDNDPDINPEAEELCNGIDDNCDGEIDEDFDFFEYFEDFDNDGYGNADEIIEDCEQPAGYVDNGEDCNDDDPDINPDAEDIPNNGIDEDCDGQDAATSTYELSSALINIYPNPSIDYLNIEISGTLDFRLDLYTAFGSRVLTQKNVVSIGVRNLMEGVYFLKITDLNSDSYIVERIVVLSK